MERWKKEVPLETERVIRANDSEHNASFNYANNHISTGKYNVFTFIPKNLFEQFQRLANAYFLFLLILQLIPAISSLNASTTIVPLCCVLILTAVKDAVDDIQRHRSDSQVNNRKSWVLRNGVLTEERWHHVIVGDIIKMKNNQFVAADMFVLSTSEPNSLCYIETAELDGETNLKLRQALPETAEMGDDVNELSKFKGVINCEPPNNRLNKFDGVLEIDRKKLSLDNDKMLLRGCVLRNTRWCYGMVIFAGKDTKLMMNSGQSIFKRTNIDKVVNVLIMGIFTFLASVCIICTVCCGVWESLVGVRFQGYLPWESYVPGAPGDDRPKAAGATVIALMVFFSYIIVLNTVVPISLYVSVEVIRFGHSWWINWDEKMFDVNTNTPARSRTTTLNEELGQIEYIFSDKTGTLTQNIMSFNKCTISGRSYGDPVDQDGEPIDITERKKTPAVDFSHLPYADETFMFYDKRLMDLVMSDDPKSAEFFRLLSLCHTVMPEEKDGKLEYQAQSPDEGALVSAAKNFGFAFKARTPTTITIDALGEEEVYELLCICDFNNVRKRMSVIVRKDGKIRLYCKGADNVIYDRTSSDYDDLKEITTSHLNDFAQDGLRTLCLAVKDIDPEYYEQWKQKHHTAVTALMDRDEKLDAVYEEIETDLQLLGATAIEDKLQDGVPDCIANLAMAGMKIWVLTGDKQETAVNIGYSCKLLTEEMEETFIIDGTSYMEVEDQLRKAYDDMLHIQKYGPDMDVQSLPDVRSPTSQKNSAINDVHDERKDKVPAALGGFALVLNGHSLVFGLEETMEKLLLDVGSMCQAVICCRVTPLQKALVVDLIKRHKKCITLAIGDGANDVSMIKTAHIGIGISGQEGLQAVLSSDFSIAQFRYLERLLLVHGRWSYLRMCKFLKYFFYKNFAFTLCHFWYAFFCGFSAQTLYDPVFISLYNLIFTSCPVLALSIFEQDVNDYYSIHYPKLYKPGHLNLLFNKKVFGQSVGEGVVTSLILFFIPYGAFHDAITSDGTDLAGHKAFGFVVASTLIVTMTLRCALDTYYWTGFNHVVIWGSISVYVGFTFLSYADFLRYSYVGVARAVMATAQFWFTVLLTVTVLLVPVVAERFFYIDTQPTLADSVRLKQKITTARSRSGDLVLRRHSTMRRSTRSIRSGYAFSHSQGFGKLITTGAMRQQAQRNGLPANNNLSS